MSRLLDQLRKKLGKLFFRILFYFLSLLIPIIIIGVVTYAYSLNTIKKDFSSKLNMNLYSSATTIDIFLQEAQETCVDFFYDYTVIEYFKPYDNLELEDMAEIQKICRVLSRKKRIAYEFVDNVFAFIDNKKVYSGDGMEDFNTFFDKFYKYEKYDKNFWLNLQEKNRYFEALPPVKVDTQLTGSVKNVIPIVATGNVSGYNAVVVVNISADTIIKTLDKNRIFNSTGFLVLDGNNNVIASNSVLLKNKNMTEAVYSMIDETDEQTNHAVGVQDNLFINYVKSENYGWRYYYVTPVNEFSKQVKGILNMTVLSCLILFIIGTVFALIFATKLYNPIHNIKNILLKNEMEVDSDEEHRKGELNIITEGVSRMTAMYRSKLSDLSNQYLDNTFINLFRGNKLECIDKVNRILKDEYYFKNSAYVCCSIQFEFQEEYYKKIQDVERFNIIDGIKEIINKTVDMYAKNYTLEYKQGLFICVVNVADRDCSMIVKEALDKIIQTFHYDSYYCKIIIGIGEIVCSLNNLKTSFDTAVTALENADAAKDFQIIDSKDIPICHNFVYTFADEKKILNCLKAGDWDNANKTVNAIVFRNKDNGVSHGCICDLFKELYNTGIRYLAENGSNIDEFVASGEYQLFEKGNIDYSIAEKIDALVKFYIEIIESFEDGKVKNGSLVSMIKEYIDNNYDKDIYLEKIAEDMGVSVKYVSRVFKEKTGENLSDYISTIRINKAKDLLSNTKMNINEVSEKVGIYSRTTFIRLFKKFEGVTPSEYRDISI